MNFRILGKKKVDYFSTKKNAQVTGVELYLYSVDDVKNGEGQYCLKPIYFSADKHSYDDFNVGDPVVVYYNQYGHVEDIVLI